MVTVLSPKSESRTLSYFILIDLSTMWGESRGADTGKDSQEEC